MSNQDKHIHFIGVGGIGMSALARYYLHEGWQVSGSDSTESENTKKLESEGAEIVYNQNNTIIYDSEKEPTKNIDIIVYTEAMSPDNPEMLAARQSGIKMLNYFEALAEVANEYYLIAVSGTHGKTTTTAMLADILEEASYDPTLVVGSLRMKTGSNFRAGKSKYFIAEACEYKRDFLHLKPDVLVITNLEHEHVDYYKDLADVQNAFRELAEKVPEDGVVVTDLSQSSIKPVVEGLKCEVVDYREYLDIKRRLTQPGVYNQLNAAAAVAVATYLGLESETIKVALENFAGTKRRFEYKGDYNNAPIYEDYAHHPTEIKATISAARDKYPNSKLTVVFQPHTYSRTKTLFADFIAALSQADRIIMMPIYAAREENQGDVSSQQIVTELQKLDKEAIHFETPEAAALEIKETVSSDDVVIVMGAGNVTQISNQLI